MTSDIPKTNNHQEHIEYNLDDPTILKIRARAVLREEHIISQFMKETDKARTIFKPYQDAWRVVFNTAWEKLCQTARTSEYPYFTHESLQAFNEEMGNAQEIYDTKRDIWLKTSIPAFKKMQRRLGESYIKMTSEIRAIPVKTEDNGKKTPETKVDFEVEMERFEG